MSAENVAFVHDLFETLNAAGWDPEAAPQFVHPEGVIHAPEEWPGQPTYAGLVGRASLIREFTATFDSFRVDVDRVVDLDDRVVGLIRVGGVSRTSGVEMDWELGLIAGDWEDGRPKDIRYFLNWEQALAAAGLDAGAE